MQFFNLVVISTDALVRMYICSIPVKTWTFGCIYTYVFDILYSGKLSQNKISMAVQMKIRG